jgi:hypothetical protein
VEIAGPLRLALHPPPRGGHWSQGGLRQDPLGQSAGASGPDEPVILLDERAPDIAAAAAASEAAFAAGHRLAAGWLQAGCRLQAILNFFKPVPRAEAVAAAAGRQAEQRALRDEQRAK